MTYISIACTWKTVHIHSYLCYLLVIFSISIIESIIPILNASLIQLNLTISKTLQVGRAQSEQLN